MIVFNCTAVNVSTSLLCSHRQETMIRSLETNVLFTTKICILVCGNTMCVSKQKHEHKVEEDNETEHGTGICLETLILEI